MYTDRNFSLQEDLPLNAAELTQDLELHTLLSAMAGEDTFLLEVANKAILASLREPEPILYRQRVLADCLEQADIVREIYAITVEAIERERRVWGGIFGRYPEGLLHRSIEVLRIFFELLKKLRHIAGEHGAKFHSEGFERLFSMLARELDDNYLGAVEDHLRRLERRNGVLMTAQLGQGNKASHYVLRKPPDAQPGWMCRLRNWVDRMPFSETSNFVYQIADRDENGLRALSEIVGRGIGHVAAALAQSTDHILSFFAMLRLELGFYIGCLNLRDKLAQKREPICFPEPVAAGNMTLCCQGLYDISLSLTIEERVVGNDVNGEDKRLVIVTGANRGGKSTFLRSIGLAQLMMQCGMFLPAESFRANVCNGLFTHFKREEDTSMRSGKLDEELSRMSSNIDNMTPNSVVLFNESFASTNEREGSEIARQIVRALLESGIKVFYVTHMFDLARGFYLVKVDTALFLRAERLAGGQRTFRLVEGEPLPTSYGEDLYRRIFGDVSQGHEEPSILTDRII